MVQTYKNYMKDYWKANCKRITIVLNNLKDADLIEALEGKNMGQTAKALMREGMKAQSK